MSIHVACAIGLCTVGLVALGGCSGGLGWATVARMIEAQYPETPSLSTDSLAAHLADAETPPLLLDVREPEEFAVSHLAGAQRVDPEAEALPEALASLPRDTPLVAYCSVGYRSAGFVQRLRAAGFTNIRNLEGSIFRWANEGRPVVRGDSAVQAVHPYSRVWGQLLNAEYRAYTPDTRP